MKTTAILIILMLSLIIQAQKNTVVLIPTVKVKHQKSSISKALELSQHEAAEIQPLWSIRIQDNPVPMELSHAETLDLLDEMFECYDDIKNHKIKLNFAQMLVFENLLNRFTWKVMNEEIQWVKRRYNVAQRWCDSMTRSMGMPSEICMNLLKKSKSGFASCDFMMIDAEQSQHPEVRLGLMQNAIDKLNQSLLMQEMAILEIHQYRKSDMNEQEEMMATDLDW